VGEPALTAITVSWNSADSLRTCLGALRRSAEATGATLEIVVVDNASEDGSAAVAEEAGADVVLRNPLNAGFVQAAAQALEHSTGAWVLFLNPDLTVEEEFVRAILDAAAIAGPEVSTLVPDIRYTADPTIVNSRGIEVDDIGVPAERLAGSPADVTSPRWRVFGGVSGGCVYRLDALRRIGGPEPCFFAFLEDVDVAWRLNRLGMKAIIVSEAVALHEGSGTVGEGSWLKSYLVARNRRLLFRLEGPHTPRARAWRLVTEIGHGIVVTAWGGGTAPWRGRLAALRHRRYTNFVRRSRALAGEGNAPAPLVPRAGLRATLERKRATAQLMHTFE
jgi:GT2 family glycosyltransferase